VSPVLSDCTYKSRFLRTNIQKSAADQQGRTSSAHSSFLIVKSRESIIESRESVEAAISLGTEEIEDELLPYEHDHGRGRELVYMVSAFLLDTIVALSGLNTFWSGTHCSTLLVARLASRAAHSTRNFEFHCAM
jgi:hypothetical protein